MYHIVHVVVVVVCLWQALVARASLLLAIPNKGRNLFPLLFYSLFGSYLFGLGYYNEAKRNAKKRFASVLQQ